MQELVPIIGRQLLHGLGHLVPKKQRPHDRRTNKQNETKKKMSGGKKEGTDSKRAANITNLLAGCVMQC